MDKTNSGRVGFFGFPFRLESFLFYGHVRGCYTRVHIPLWSETKKGALPPPPPPGATKKAARPDPMTVTPVQKHSMSEMCNDHHPLVPTEKSRGERLVGQDLLENVRRD